jgi:hypothetical protein
VSKLTGVAHRVLWGASGEICEFLRELPSLMLVELSGKIGQRR